MYLRSNGIREDYPISWIVLAQLYRIDPQTQLNRTLKYRSARRTEPWSVMTFFKTLQNEKLFVQYVFVLRAMKEIQVGTSMKTTWVSYVWSSRSVVIDSRPFYLFIYFFLPFAFVKFIVFPQHVKTTMCRVQSGRLPNIARKMFSL